MITYTVAVNTFAHSFSHIGWPRFGRCEGVATEASLHASMSKPNRPRKTPGV